MARPSSSGTTGEADFRRALEGALAEVAADDGAGSLLRATKMRIRFRFTDVDLVLNVCAGDDVRENVRWAFTDDVDWEHRLELEMTSDVANGYLQERESLAVAIARGKVRCHGEAKVALIYLPALRLLWRPYRRVVDEGFPQLALD